MSEQQVNIPLLRKAVEWAEAEAAKPPELCEWEQNWFVLTAEQRKNLQDVYDDAERSPLHYRAMRKAPECPDSEGARLLGLSWGQSERLFDGGNTIADVRRIAEAIAGERL